MLSNEHPLFSMLGVMEGVVLRAYFRDDAANLSKQWTEYDLLEVNTRERFRAARVVNLFAGVDNGGEITLTETTGTTDGTPLVVEEEDMVASQVIILNPTSPLGLTHTTKMNGERVGFICLSGAKTSPMIIGSLPHTEAAYNAKRSESPRAFRTINGWIESFNNDGSFVLRRKKNDKEQQSIVIDKDGNVTVVAKQGSRINFGQAADEHAPLGDTLKVKMEELIDKIVAITVPTAVGPSGPPLNSADFLQLRATLGEFLSNHIFVKKDSP